MKIGAQLYTVRDYCKTLEDFSETLKKIADIGYKHVQVSGACAFQPEWLKEQLQKNDLECAITHTSPERIAQVTEEVITEHKIFDCHNIGIGYWDITSHGVNTFVDKFQPAARKINQSGCYLMYHNHDVDFKVVEGKTIMEHLINRFTSEELGFTLDTFWIQAAGGDPIWWINYLSGRIPCVHLKDMSYGNIMEPVGYGNMNMEGIVKACAAQNVEYLLVEQDNCNGQDPFLCLQKSFIYLKSII